MVGDRGHGNHRADCAQAGADPRCAFEAGGESGAVEPLQPAEPGGQRQRGGSDQASQTGDGVIDSRGDASLSLTKRAEDRCRERRDERRHAQTKDDGRREHGRQVWGAGPDACEEQHAGRRHERAASHR